MKIISNLEYKNGLTGDIFLPETEVPANGFPAAVLIHGGGWSMGDRYSVNGIADFLVENNFAVFNIEYRLSPQNLWPSGLEDCQDALKWLFESDYPIDRQKIFFIGASAGGHYALIAGLTLPREMVCGIVSISGIDDTFEDYKLAPDRYDLLLGRTPSEKDLTELNPASYLTDNAPPILCTHWRLDRVVPFEACTNFEKAATARGIKTCIYGYNYDRHCEGHDIWIPGSNPHRLHPDLEAVIAGFLKTISGVMKDA